MYINLVSTLRLSDVARVQRSNLLCSLEHHLILKECGCIDRGNATQLAQLDSNVATLNARLHNFTAEWQDKLAAMGRDKDVAVVEQGFLENVGPQVRACALVPCVFWAPDCNNKRLAHHFYPVTDPLEPLLTLLTTLIRSH